MEEGAAKATALLRLLGHEQRLLVLCLLMEHGELSVTQLLQHVNLSQSALSQHLAKMREQGLVTFRRESQTLYYRIAREDAVRVIETLKQLFCP